MGRVFLRYLSDPNLYVCNTCGAHLSSAEQVISKAFHGRGGKAYLMDYVVNTLTGPHERRVLITGLHTVADIYCASCQTCVGWRYIEALEEQQKYKEGKFILERVKIEKLPETWAT